MLEIGTFTGVTALSIAALVLDPDSADEDTVALRRFVDQVQADPRVDNALLTVADGLLLIWKCPR